VATGIRKFEEITRREMMNQWVEAGGSYQFPFMGAGSRIINGDYIIDCPKCGQARLRFYFHIFKPEQGTGTIWVWCPNCRTTCHLPRVKPHVPGFPDPFKDLGLEEFAGVEMNETEPFLDRLDRLWSEGVLGDPTNLKR
jgi:hypothetical protein